MPLCSIFIFNPSCQSHVLKYVMCVRVVDALLLKAFDVLRNKGEAKELSVAIYCPTHSLTHKQSHTLKDTNTHSHIFFDTDVAHWCSCRPRSFQPNWRNRFTATHRLETKQDCVCYSEPQLWTEMKKKERNKNESGWPHVCISLVCLTTDQSVPNRKRWCA